jgi:hypothetical protein
MQIWYRVMTQPPCASVDPLDDALLTFAPLLAPQSPIRPPPAPGPTGVARGAPGVGGCNIVLPPSRTTVATQDALHRSSLNDLERPPIKIETNCPRHLVAKIAIRGRRYHVTAAIDYVRFVELDDIYKLLFSNISA